jgi:hypothetical protein
MSALFVSLALWMLAAFSYAQAPTFYWDMETANATIYAAGSDSMPGYYANITRSIDYAYEGTYSLKMQDAWAEAFFDNPSNNDVWMPVTEGTVELYWKYIAPWGNRMLFQITGKSANQTYDTNDGISLRTRGDSPGRFDAGICFDSCLQSLGLRTPAITMTDGQWYRFRVKYRAGGTPNFSVQIDDLTPFTATGTIGATACLAWHQVLIGNDLLTPGAVQYIDNFKIWNVWMNDIPTVVNEKIPPTHMPSAVSVTPNPMRDRIEFTQSAGQIIQSLTIFDRSGHIVQTPRCGVSSWADAHAPAGLYFYAIRTDQGETHGSFIKTK